MKVTKHDELGANHKVLQGGFAGTLGYTFPMENPKPFFHVLGGLIEQPIVLEVDNIAEFGDGETVFLTNSTTVYGVVDSTEAAESPEPAKIRLKQFVKGEIITGATNSATAELLRIEGPTMYLKKLDTNLFVDDEVLTGGTSGAKVTGIDVTGTPSAVVGVVESVTIAKPSNDDVIEDAASESNSDATISDIIYHHNIFAWRDGPSYSIVWVYEDMDVGASESPQKLFKGCVAESVALDVTSNDVPKMKEAWQLAEPSDEDVKDTKQSNDVTTLFEWTNIPDTTGFLINSVDYSGLFKTLTIEVKRKLGKIWGNSRNPKALKGATIESTLKVGIHRQDIVERNLVNNWGTSAGVAIAASFVFNRGIALEDGFTVSYAALRVPKISESVGDETILQDLELEVEGTPIVDSYDKIQYYGSSA